jgi:hypothetical protein
MRISNRNGQRDLATRYPGSLVDPRCGLADAPGLPTSVRSAESSGRQLLCSFVPAKFATAFEGGTGHEPLWGVPTSKVVANHAAEETSH